MGLKIDFSEYLFRIGFDSLPAEYLGYSGFLLTELWLSLSTQPQQPTCTHHTRHHYTSHQTPLHITPDTTTHHTRHHYTSHQTPLHITPDTHLHNHSYQITQDTTTHHTRQPQLPTSHQIPPAHNHSCLHRLKLLGLYSEHNHIHVPIVGGVPTLIEAWPR